MSSYPDPDDARNAKQGSDHDRAEAWRVLALSERRRAEQAEAEAARLRCCGNCGHRDEETLDYYGSYFVCLTEFKPKTNMRHMEVDCEDQCQFTPSRWERREP